MLFGRFRFVAEVVDALAADNAGSIGRSHYPNDQALAQQRSHGVLVDQATRPDVQAWLELLRRELRAGPQARLSCHGWGDTRQEYKATGPSDF